MVDNVQRWIYLHWFCHNSAVTVALMSQMQLISNGDQWEDKSAQNSTTDVSFCTIIIRLSRCKTVNTMV